MTNNQRTCQDCEGGCEEYCPFSKELVPKMMDELQEQYMTPVIVGIDTALGGDFVGVSIVRNGVSFGSSLNKACCPQTFRDLYESGRIQIPKSPFNSHRTRD